jgi:hypothetical protein
VRAFAILSMAVLVAIAVGVGAAATSDTATSNTATSGSRHSTDRWNITPRPPLLRLAATGPCPATVSSYRDVLNSGTDLTNELLPEGALFGHICRYGTVEGRPYLLVKSANINGRTVTEFESAIAKISTARPVGIASCPAAFSSVTILAFGFQGRPDVDLWFIDTGCQTLDNGRLEASEISNRGFYDDFDPLVDLIAPEKN